MLNNDYRIRYWVIVGFVLAIHAPSATNGRQTDPKPVPPIAAFLALDHSPVGALLEAELLQLPDATWVERSAISKVLDEQKLQILFDPQAVGERVKLGQLLKADLLILLRRGEQQKVAYLEITVAGVSQGLRLVNQRIPVSADPEADAARLLKQIQIGFAKHRKPIDALFAVPPFVSNDLVYEHDDLRGAYMRLVEAQLLEQPNILVVELAEAEALTKELSLPTSDSIKVQGNKVSRKLPYYFVGRYRNVNKGGDRRVDIQVTLKQGAREIGRFNRQTKPEEVAVLLRGELASLLKRITGRESSTADPKSEAELLLLSAKEHLKLGGFEEATSLAEASILIEPNQVEPHVVAIRALTPLFTAHWGTRAHWGDRSFSVSEVQLALAYYFRGVQHMIHFFRNGGDLTRYRDGGQSDFSQESFAAAGLLEVHPHCSPEVKAHMVEVHAHNRELMLQLAGLVVESSPRLASLFMVRGMPGLTETQFNELQLELILRYQHLPNARAITREFACQLRSVDVLNRPGGQHLLDALEKQGNEQVQAEVVVLRKSLQTQLAENERQRMLREQDFDPLEPVPAGADRISIKPLKLDVEAAAGVKGELKYVCGWLATSAGFDVAWTGNGLYLMHQKGILERVTYPHEATTRFSRSYEHNGHSSVCFDGHFVWIVAYDNTREPRILMIEPTTKKVIEVTSNQGLPCPNAGNGAPSFDPIRLSIAPISPGKILVAGGFGRAWLGECTYAAQDGVKLRVFHEAKETAEKSNRDHWRDTSLSFIPGNIFLVPGSGGPGSSSKRFLVGRTRTQIEAVQHPLIVDSESRRVEVCAEPFWSEAVSLEHSPVNNAIYFVHNLPPMFNTISLLRMGGADLKTEPILTLPREGYVLAEPDRVHIVGHQWWIADLKTKQVVPAGAVPWSYTIHLAASGPVRVRVNQPNLEMLARSNHYGIVAYYAGGPTKGSLVQITFSK